MRVLFVCTANICRSAFAEKWTQHLLADLDPEGAADLEVASAGVNGLRSKPVERHMAAQLVARGASAEGFESRLLTPTVLRGADLVVTMEAWHRERILTDRPDLVWRTYVLGQLARVVDGVPDDVRGMDLVGALRGAHRPPIDADDVEDPYRRGNAVYTSVSARLEDLLGRIVPRLVDSPAPSAGSV